MRRTLAAPFTRRGVGIHSGAAAVATVEPAAFGMGVVFADEAGREVRADVAHVREVPGATVLASAGLQVGMVEHLLAALYAAGVTDARVLLRGPELPVLDGSARPWVEGIDEVGTIEGPPDEAIEILRPIRIAEGEASAEALPGAPSVRVEVDFGPSLRGSLEVPISSFRDEICWARTFAMEADAERLLAAGRGKGATHDNTVIWGATGPLRPARSDDEPIRHKLLDAIGDLALLGAPLHGRVIVRRGSHRLHHALVRAIRDTPEAWTLRSAPAPEVP